MESGSLKPKIKINLKNPRTEAKKIDDQESKEEKEAQIKEDKKSDSDDQIFEKDPETPLGFRIKRPKDEVVHHKSKFLKDNSNFIAITGASGTGKSVSLLTILPFFTNFLKYIILASCKYQDPAHKAVENYCKHEKIEYHYVHEPEECGTAIADTLDQKKENEHMLVIFDDWNTNYTSKGEDPYNNLMIKVFAMLRSSNCSAIAVTQTYYNIPPKVRENLSMRIVFALGNVLSIRIMLDDICGLFINTENERTLKQDIKKIYQKVFDKPHEFLVVISNPQPPQIRIGWNQIVYPLDLIGKVEAGEMNSQSESLVEGMVNPKVLDQAFQETEPNKKPIGKGIQAHQALYQQARDLGFPKFLHQPVTKDQLEKFVNLKTAKGQKSIGNNAPELGKGGSLALHDDPSIQNILENIGIPSEERLFKQLIYRIRQYRMTDNPKQLKMITEIANELANMGSDLNKVKYIIRKNHLQDEIELD